MRPPAKWFLCKLASYLAGQSLPDLNSGMRLMRKDLVERYRHLLPSGFLFTTTITLACACNGRDVEYVTIDYHERIGQSWRHNASGGEAVSGQSVTPQVRRGTVA